MKDDDQYYAMRVKERRKVNEWARENGWPEMGTTITPILITLLTHHKFSLIAGVIDEVLDHIFLLKDRIDEAVREGNLVACVLMKERYDEEKKKLLQYERMLTREAPVETPAGKTTLGKEDKVTDEMILRAREYPFEDLLPDLKRNRCRCPLHGGYNPMSFEVKNNYGRCHSCGWYGDTIAFVMQDRGISFIDAVRSLQ